MNLPANQTKYGWMEVANFTIDNWNYDCRIMYGTKLNENLLLLKDLLEP